MPCVKWYEDDNFITILDINPNVKGASLFIPKVHQPSDFGEADTTLLQTAVLAIKTPINKLKKYFNTSRVAVVVEGVGINHLHFKLYPLIKHDRQFEESADHVYFEQYPGHITTKTGPKASFEELRDLGDMLGKL